MEDIIMEKTTGVRDRLFTYLKYKNLTQREFQNTIGVSGCYVRNISNSIGADKQISIKENYPDLNMGWLLSGDGEMLNNSNIMNISMVGNNKTGDINQNNNSNNSASYDDLYKQIIELKDKLASIKNKVFRARICPTIDEMQKKLDDIMLDDE